jgi:S-adenosylmethionine-diacylglycerol 3-amino-3-carboxypropyl transferase
MGNFFSRLSFSFGNEDWRTEAQALKVAPDSRVLCITASGDRSLNLLLDPCNTLVSLDANPVQNHLLTLKKVAMEHLSTSEYLAFLGATPSSTRLKILQLLIHEMDPAAANFWNAHKKMVEQGVLYQGKVERYVKWAKVPFFFRRKEIRALFECDTLEAQRKLLRHHWSHGYWKTLFKWGLKPYISRLALQDPGLYDYVEKNVDPGVYMYERMIRCFDHCLARESALASLILLQTVGKEAFPPYLTPEGIRDIKPNLNRITTITQDAISYLEEVPDSSFDRFSLSDISSYLDRPNFERLLRAIYRAARPGARFCLRQLMTRYSIPADLSPHFVRDIELEEQLEAEDRAFVYQFTVGTILKS